MRSATSSARSRGRTRRCARNSGRPACAPTPSPIPPRSSRSDAADPAKIAPFVAQLKAQGMTQDQFALMANTPMLMTSPANVQCDITRKLYDAIAQMPAPEKAWVTAYLMSEAAKALR